MTPLAGIAVVAVFAAATGGTGPAPQPGTSPSPARTLLSPSLVLMRYNARLAGARRPTSVVFQYTVAQLGLHNFEQTHRVYRSGASERDETVVVDGHTLQYPSIRVFAKRSDRYDVAAVAPRSGSYRFTFSGVHRGARSESYVFKTARVTNGAFAVSEIEVDGRAFLPSVVRFKIAGNGARGSGELRFGRSQSYWLVHQADVSSRLTNGTTAHERITWSNYQFPASLPSSTFSQRRVVPTPLLAPTPTPTPAEAPLSPL